MKLAHRHVGGECLRKDDLHSGVVQFGAGGLLNVLKGTVRL